MFCFRNRDPLTIVALHRIASDGLLGVRDAEHWRRALAVLGQPGHDFLGRWGSHEHIIAAHSHPQAELSLL